MRVDVVEVVNAIAQGNLGCISSAPQENVHKHLVRDSGTD